MGVDAMLHNADRLSGHSLMTPLGEGKNRSFNKITRNCVLHCRRIVGNWYVNNAAMTLATMLATVPLLF